MFSYTAIEAKRRQRLKEKGQKIEELSTLEKRFEVFWDRLFPETEWIRQAKPLPRLQLPGRSNPTRMRFDYQCGKVLVECQGAVFGRIIKYRAQPYVLMRGHNSPKGLTDDHLKANHAAAHGFLLFYISEKTLVEGTLHQIQRTIDRNQENC